MPPPWAQMLETFATFNKNSKYILLDKHLVDFANTAIDRPDMKDEHDVFNLVMPRDDIAVITFSGKPRDWSTPVRQQRTHFPE